MAVTVYSKPACSACNATYRKMGKEGILYDVVDISVDEEAYEYVKSLGYARAPVIVTDDDHWSGFQPDKIAALAKAAA